MRGPRAGRERGVLIRRIALLALLSAACSTDPPPAEPDSSVDPAVGRADAVAADSARADGVAIAGRVIGGPTGEPVEGAYVVVLGPEVTLARWEDASGPESEALMEAATVTDDAGAYEILDLAPGRRYTLIVAAEGYEPAVFDHGLSIRDDDPPVVRPEAVRLDPRPR